MPPKDLVPSKLYVKLTSGITAEIDNDKPISEISRLFEELELVRVVRCKDCKWWDEYHECALMDERRMGWDDFDKRTRPDWYCADGERAEE